MFVLAVLMSCFAISDWGFYFGIVATVTPQCLPGHNEKTGVENLSKITPPNHGFIYFLWGTKSGRRKSLCVDWGRARTTI